MSENIAASLSLWRDRFVFTSKNFTGEQSCRPATVLLIGTAAPLRIRTATASLSGRAFLIGAGVDRSLDARSADLYSLNLDPTNAYCRALRAHVGANGVLDMSSRMHRDTLASAAESVSTVQSCAEVYRTSQRILDALFPDVIGSQPIDSRIDLVASYLWNHVPVRAELAFLAGLCGLSQSRLAHLFTEQVGISIRQYLLWVKMRKAADMFVRNLSLSHVASEIGFSDAPHLSRTFMRYFALTPSFLANKNVVRVQVCEATARK